MDKPSGSRGIYDNCYKGSNTIDMSAYFAEFKNLINESNFFKTNLDKSDIMKMIGDVIDEEKFDLLSTYCSPDHLTVEGELPKMTKNSFEWFKEPEDPSVLENCNLKTVVNAKKRHSLRNYQLQLKYRSEKIIVSCHLDIFYFNLLIRFVFLFFVFTAQLLIFIL